MKWLAAITKGFFEALFGWGQGQAEKAPTTKDANTPEEVKTEMRKSIEKWMVEKDKR